MLRNSHKYLALVPCLLGAGLLLAGCTSVQTDSGKGVDKGKVIVSSGGKETIVDGTSTISAKSSAATVVTTNEANVKIRCESGASVELLGTKASAALTGDCGKVSISGVNLSARIDTASKVSAGGVNLKMSAKEVGSVEADGTGSRLTLGTVGDVRLNGIDQKLTYQQLTGTVTKQGANNEATQG